MKRKKSNIRPVLILLIGSIGYVACAENIYTKPDGSVVTKDFRRDFSWLNESWSGNSRLYTEIRQDLKKLTENGDPSGKLHLQYKKQFLKNPKDPKLLFKWAYVAYRTVGADVFNSKDSGCAQIRDWLYTVKSPAVAEFTRIRFLLEVRVYRGIFTEGSKLIPVGKRLLTVDPNDAGVRDQLATLYIESDDLSKIDEGIDIVKDLLKEANPNNYYRSKSDMASVLVSIRPTTQRTHNHVLMHGNPISVIARIRNPSKTTRG